MRDEARPLTKDGRQQATRLGGRVKELMAGGTIVHSPARRARETAEIIAEAASATLIELEELYYADEYDLLRRLPPLDEPLMVVGHAPTIPLAASLIASGDGPELIALRGCPTATAYVFDIDSLADHAGLRAGSAELKDIIITPV